MLNISPTKEEFLVEKVLENFYKGVTLQGNQTSIEFHLENHGIFTCKDIVENTFLIVVTESLRNRILYEPHFLLIAEHIGQRKRYDVQRRSYCFPLLKNYINTIVAKGEIGVQKGN